MTTLFDKYDGDLSTGSERDFGERWSVPNGSCFYCPRVWPEDCLDREHLIPRSKGGVDENSNIVLSCKCCNSGEKRTKTHREFIASKVEGFRADLNSITMLYYSVLKEDVEELIKIERNIGDKAYTTHIRMLRARPITSEVIESSRKLFSQWNWLSRIFFFDGGPRFDSDFPMMIGEPASTIPVLESAFTDELIEDFLCRAIGITAGKMVDKDREIVTCPEDAWLSRLSIERVWKDVIDTKIRERTEHYQSHWATYCNIGLECHDAIAKLQVEAHQFAGRGVIAHNECAGLISAALTLAQKFSETDIERCVWSFRCKGDNPLAKSFAKFIRTYKPTYSLKASKEKTPIFIE